MQKSFTGQKAMFLNMAQDGIKIRANKIQSKKAYKRNQKHRNSEY